MCRVGPSNVSSAKSWIPRSGLLGDGRVSIRTMSAGWLRRRAIKRLRARHGAQGWYARPTFPQPSAIPAGSSLEDPRYRMAAPATSSIAASTFPVPAARIGARWSRFGTTPSPRCSVSPAKRRGPNPPTIPSFVRSPSIQPTIVSSGSRLSRSFRPIRSCRLTVAHVVRVRWRRWYSVVRDSWEVSRVNGLSLPIPASIV